MLSDQTLPWIIAAALLVVVIAVVVVLLVLRRRLTQARRAADEQARQARAEQDARDAHHDTRMARTTAEHTREKEALATELGTENKRLADQKQAALDEAEQTRAMLSTGLKYEATSRELIAAACRAAGADVVLLTNVVFVPAASSASGRFVAQVDHVLVGETGAMVVENKGWRGIVFDGRRPSSVFPAFGGLFDESTMSPPFALQVVDDSPTVLTVRSHLGTKSPASQVRRQANRLSDRVHESIDARLWFDTCVLYSHPKATVFAVDQDRSEGGAATQIVSTPTQLEAVVRELISRPTKKLSQARVEDVTALLASYGADVLRFGAFAEEARAASAAPVASTASAPAPTPEQAPAMTSDPVSDTASDTAPAADTDTASAEASDRTQA